jgi:neutral ceramidase
MSASALQAGIARRDITPAPGTPLFGYPTERLGHEVADALNATALFLQSGEVQACIISLDWCLIDAEEVAHLRLKIAKACNVAAENITFSATHTHSGPTTVECWGWGDKNAAYLASARDAIVACAVDAQAALVAVRVGIGTTRTQTGINRREVNNEGDVILGFHEWGAYDDTLTVLRFETESGTLASLVHLGAHPTSRGGEPSVSRDWPGTMMDRVEKITGAPVLFLNGAFGDVAPRTNKGGAASTEVGLRAASDALQAWRGIKEFRALDLQTYSEVLALPHAPLPALEEAQHQAIEYADGEAVLGTRHAEWRYWNAVLAAHAEEPRPSRDWQQTIIRIGPVVLVPFAGEIFSEIALRLKKASPFAHTLCLGTSNGSHGYYVTREARARGGYEPWVAKAYGAYILADDIDDVLVRENLRLLQEAHAAGIVERSLD